MTKGIRKRLKLIKIDRKEIIDAINNGCINWGHRPSLVNSNWFFDSKTDVLGQFNVFLVDRPNQVVYHQKFYLFDDGMVWCLSFNFEPL